MSQEAEGIVVPKGAKVKPLPPQEFLRECFDFSEETGILTWRLRPVHHFENEGRSRQFNKTFAGKEAGCKYQANSTQGLYYKVVNVFWNGKTANYMVHRLVWVWLYGTIPDGLRVDHKDTNGINNRPDNLRLADLTQNGYNKRITKRDLPRGVYVAGKKFKVHFSVRHKSFHLGTFETIEAASAAYEKKARELAGAFFRA